MKTALSYLRVSTSAQADTDERDPEGYSIPAQREACQRKAHSLGLTIVDEYVDRGESARSADRPALKRLLERVKAGDIDCVLVHKVDRLAGCSAHRGSWIGNGRDRSPAISAELGGPRRAVRAGVLAVAVGQG